MAYVTFISKTLRIFEMPSIIDFFCLKTTPTRWENAWNATGFFMETYILFHTVRIRLTSFNDFDIK